jgi:hypothetical protein
MVNTVWVKLLHDGVQCHPSKVSHIFNLILVGASVQLHTAFTPELGAEKLSALFQDSNLCYCKLVTS